MSIKSGCLCLLLIVVSAWTDDLQAGTFVIYSPMGTPLFGQEVLPISAKNATEIRQEIELPWQVQVGCAGVAAPSVDPLAVLLGDVGEQKAAVHSGVDLRYLLMSIQP
jgi:hypothetical protein